MKSIMLPAIVIACFLPSYGFGNEADPEIHALKKIIAIQQERILKMGQTIEVIQQDMLKNYQPRSENLLKIDEHVKYYEAEGQPWVSLPNIKSHDVVSEGTTRVQRDLHVSQKIMADAAEMASDLLVGRNIESAGNISGTDFRASGNLAVQAIEAKGRIYADGDIVSNKTLSGKLLKVSQAEITGTTQTYDLKASHRVEAAFEVHSGGPLTAAGNIRGWDITANGSMISNHGVSAKGDISTTKNVKAWDVKAAGAFYTDHGLRAKKDIVTEGDVRGKNGKFSWDLIGHHLYYHHSHPQ